MLYCDFCRRENIYMRRIKSDDNKRGYVQSCKACESENELEHAPTYALSDLVEFCEQRMFDGCFCPTPRKGLIQNVPTFIFPF